MASIALAVGVVTGPANSFVFVYAQNVLKLSGDTQAAMVVVASVFGLSGLLLGRFLADRFGRRPTGALAMVAMALTAVVTYSGSKTALLVGYEIAVLSGVDLRAGGRGTRQRAVPDRDPRPSVAGWNVAASVVGAVVGLLVFGAVADVGNRFAVGAVVTFLPVVLATGLFLLLPETRGQRARGFLAGDRVGRTGYGRRDGVDRGTANDRSRTTTSSPSLSVMVSSPA